MNFDMTHYIDADLLRAEIDKRYAEYRAKMKTDDFTYYEGMADALDLFEQYIDSLQQEMWKPSYEQMKALEVAGKTFASFKELNMNTQRAWKIFHEPLESLGNDLAKLMKL